MEISTQIKNKTRWHIVKGAINIEELTRHLKELYNSSNFDPDMNVFWDLREADFRSVSPENVHYFTNFVGQNWGKGGKSKAALVVSHDLGYGISRMYEIMMESKTSSGIAIFKDIDKAKEWIDT